MKSKILVVGSNNSDMVIKADRLPKAGETILGGTFFMKPGGKGANQAVAAARLGGQVTFISKIGNDIFGRQAVELFEEEGIDTSHIFSDPDHPSGVALITVDKHAENCIVVASGANATLLPNNLSNLKDVIANAGLVLMQLEIPLETVEYVTNIAYKARVNVILNPAPAQPLSDELLKMLHVITPNRVEAEMLTGVKVENLASAKLAAEMIRKKGVKHVIITLGTDGALLLNDSGFTLIPADKVTPVDTTGAGDVFNGALAVALCEEQPTDNAVLFACKAAGNSVTKLGAQASAPYRKELINL